MRDHAVGPGVVRVNVLAVGAHPDDIELGCGGALLRHVLAGDRVVMLVITAGERGPGTPARRVEEQQRAAAEIGAELVWGGFPDGDAGADPRALVECVEQVLREHAVDLAYVHGERDSHQDHRAVALASLGATRRCPRVLAYESPSALGFRPSVFVDVADVLDKKVAALSSHSSQVRDSAMLDLEHVRSQASYHGFQARGAAAEGFEVVRYLLAV